MAFVEFMKGGTGRGLRIVAGFALIALGLVAMGGAGGIIVALIGLVPLGAGLANVCLVAPVFGFDLRGNRRSQGA